MVIFTRISPEDKYQEEDTIFGYHRWCRIAVYPHGFDVFHHKDKEDTPGDRCSTYWVSSKCPECEVSLEYFQKLRWC